MEIEDQPVADATEEPAVPGNLESHQVPRTHLPCRDISCQLGAGTFSYHISNAR